MEDMNMTMCLPQPQIDPVQVQVQAQVQVVSFSSPPRRNTPSPPANKKKTFVPLPPRRQHVKKPSNSSMTSFSSSWESRNDVYLLTHALYQFAQIEGKSEGWPERRVRDMELANIGTMEHLETTCRENTINSILTSVGAAAAAAAAGTTTTFLPETVTRLDRFLQGPCGRNCFRLAKEAVERVENGTGVTKYVHRKNAIAVLKEIWDVEGGGGDDATSSTSGDWIMHVDCAGFIRNMLGTILENEPSFVACLSDRPFMRAKDFFTFFERLPCTISDLGTSTTYWRRVDDMRRLLPGDIIAYRILGRAAGGAAFTSKEDKNTKAIFTAMKAAQLYEEVEESEGFVSRDLTRHAAVKEWVAEICGALEPMGIVDYNSLKENMDKVKQLLEQRGESENTLELLDEVMDSNQTNTGHIMVCAGPAEPNATNPLEFRVPVFHSTKSKVKPGVQRGYKRIVATNNKDYKVWQRNVGDDDVYGDNDVFVNAARMAF
jgi:hypothetical protein